MSLFAINPHQVGFTCKIWEANEYEKAQNHSIAFGITSYEWPLKRISSPNNVILCQKKLLQANLFFFIIEAFPASASSQFYEFILSQKVTVHELWGQWWWKSLLSESGPCSRLLAFYPASTLYGMLHFSTLFDSFTVFSEKLVVHCVEVWVAIKVFSAVMMGRCEPPLPPRLHALLGDPPPNPRSLEPSQFHSRHL